MPQIQSALKKNWVSVVVMSIVVAVVDVPIVISLAILMYSGEMAPFVPFGIGTLLVGGIISNLFIGLFSSVRGVVAGPQDSPAAILAIMIAAISGGMLLASPADRFATVFVLIALVSIISGVFFILIGKFNLSRFIRFIPYPVIGGFVAGTGLLLTLGSFSVMTDISPSLTNLGIFFKPEIFSRWIFGAIFAIVLVVATRRSQKYWVIPAILGSVLAIFYGYALIAGKNIAQLHEAHLLLGPFHEGILWKPLSPSMFSQVNWMLLIEQWPNLAVIAIISTVSLLLTSSALELIANENADLERELVVSGIANILGGLGGSSVSYTHLSITALPIRAGVKTRLNGVFVAVMYLVVLIFGAELLNRTPRFMIGGFLLFLGLSFLMEWVYDARKTLPRIDYALVLVILAIVGGVGFLEGVGVGVLIAVVLFAINYSRLEFVKNTLDGTSYRSSIERPLEHRRLIQEQGCSISILRLQGYLFFGTAQNLLNRIRARITDPSHPKLHYLLMDFQRVSAVDSSVTISFVRIMQLTASHHIHLILTNINPEIKKKLIQYDLVEQEIPQLKIFSTLDHGMEWCEDHILSQDERSQNIQTTTLDGKLQQIFTDNSKIQRFLDYLEKRELYAGEVLIQQGDISDAIYFVEEGELIARLETGAGEFVRLRSMGGGMVVGEVGIYLQHDRTVSIIASKPSTVFRLGEEALKRMEKESPELASRLHFWNARQLSERLADNNRTIEALLD